VKEERKRKDQTGSEGREQSTHLRDGWNVVILGIEHLHQSASANTHAAEGGGKSCFSIFSLLIIHNPTPGAQTAGNRSNAFLNRTIGL
jgi:hypothetical protein